MARRLVVLTLAWAALYAHSVSGRQAQPQSAPVFRSTVDAVELDVFVTDRQGNPVTDLTADEFVVEEDGVSQSISSFGLVDIALKQAAAAETAVEPDVQTNVRTDGRLYVFAIDSLSGAYALRTRLFLRRFIEQHFTADDIAALVYLQHGQARNTQDFTRNTRLLLRAVDNIMGRFEPTGFAAESGGAIRPGGASGASQLNYVGGRNVATDGLRALTESLAQIRGRRKVMLYFTHGLGMDVLDTLEHAGGTRSIAFDDLHAAIGAATRGNVPVYPINPAGLTLDGSLSEAVDLRALAYATGAEAIVNTNAIESGLAQIVRENSSYYVLGYSSTNDRREGRFRNVRVRVTRPDLDVRTRRGYLEPLRTAAAPRMTPIGTLPSALARAVEQPLSNPSVPIQAFAAPYRARNGRAAVLIAQELQAESLRAVQNGDAGLELAGTAIAVRYDGKVYGDGSQLGALGRVPAGEGKRAPNVRLISEIEVPPGRYQLRIAGGTLDRAGSVMYDLDVPDYEKERFSLSGVALTSTAAAAVPTVDQSAHRLPLPGPVTSAREFSASETVTLYAEVYENIRRAPAHTVDLVAELRTADGQVVRTVSQQRSSTDLADGSNGFTIDVPLAGAAAGPHVLHVEAKANTREPMTIGREIPIRVK